MDQSEAPTEQTLAVRLPTGQVKFIRELAARSGQTISSVVERIVEESAVFKSGTLPPPKAAQTEPVAVSAAVFEGIQAALDNKGVNLLDARAVAAACRELGYREAARWACEHPRELITAYFCGFVV